MGTFSLLKSEAPLTQVQPHLPASRPILLQTVFCAAASEKVVMLKYRSGHCQSPMGLSVAPGAGKHTHPAAGGAIHGSSLSVPSLSPTVLSCTHGSSLNTFPLSKASCSSHFRECPLSIVVENIDGVLLSAWHCAVVQEHGENTWPASSPHGAPGYWARR